MVTHVSSHMNQYSVYYHNTDPFSTLLNQSLLELMNEWPVLYPEFINGKPAGLCPNMACSAPISDREFNRRETSLVTFHYVRSPLCNSEYASSE